MCTFDRCQRKLTRVKLRKENKSFPRTWWTLHVIYAYYARKATFRQVTSWLVETKPIETQRLSGCFEHSMYCTKCVLGYSGAETWRETQDRSKVLFFFSRFQMTRPGTKLSRRTPICPFKHGRSRNRGYHSPSWRYQRPTTTLARSHQDNLAVVDAEDRTWGRIRYSGTFIGNAARNLSFNVRSVLSDVNGRLTGCVIFADNIWTKLETWRPIC